MADDSTDTLFGFIIFLLFLALLGYAASGASWPSSTTGTTTTKPTPTYTTTPSTTATNKSATNIPGGPLKTCPGKIIANKTNSSSDGSVNIKVYYSAKNDRNCVVATRFGWANKMQGRLRASLRFSDYSGNQWPEYAFAWSQPHTTQVVGVYLDDTYNRCVSASASFTPYTGMNRLSVSARSIGCN